MSNSRGKDPDPEEIAEICSTCGNPLAEDRVRVPIAGPFPSQPVPASAPEVCSECGGPAGSNGMNTADRTVARVIEARRRDRE